MVGEGRVLGTNIAGVPDHLGGTVVLGSLSLSLSLLRLLPFPCPALPPLPQAFLEEPTALPFVECFLPTGGAGRSGEGDLSGDGSRGAFLNAAEPFPIAVC